MLGWRKRLVRILPNSRNTVFQLIVIVETWLRVWTERGMESNTAAYYGACITFSIAGVVATVFVVG
jgi:hypothetical protein